MSLHELVISEDGQPALSVASSVRDDDLPDTQLISVRSLPQGFTPIRAASSNKHENPVGPVSATLTVPEAARLLGIGRNLAYDIASRDGEIAGVPVIRVGRRLLIPLARLLEVLGLNDDSTQFESKR
jgi:hypothetical protein